jgi:hypothetical protein
MIEKLLKQTVRTRNSNNRRYARISHEAEIPKCVFLIDSKGQRISSKLIDLSVDGCRVLVSNMKLFENTKMIIEFNSEEFGLSGVKRLRAKIIWSELYNVDLARYCSVGLRFISDELPDLNLHQRSLKEQRITPIPQS